MGKADGLSRRLDWKVGIENDGNNKTLIKEQWIYNLAEVVIEESEVVLGILEDKSLQYELGDVWTCQNNLGPQLMCCTSYKSYSCNFRKWSCKEL